jgi:hypothetical protein
VPLATKVHRSKIAAGSSKVARLCGWPATLTKEERGAAYERLTLSALVKNMTGGGSRKGSKGNAVCVWKHAKPRLPPQL